MPMLLILLEDVGCWFEKPDTGGPEIEMITNQMKLENNHQEKITVPYVF